MKRLALPLLIGLGWLALLGAGSAQVGTGDGSPPQTGLFNDALLLARATPFLIGLGVVVGIFQARAAAQGQAGDALLGDRVRRHDFSSVISHWMNAVGMILGLVTGAMVLRWTGRTLEVRTLFAIHYIGAALILFAIFNHWTRHGVSGGLGLIPKSLRVIRDLIGELLEYTGLYGPEGAVLRLPWPKAIRQPIARYASALLGYKPHNSGKYLATEQILSYPPWTILVLTIVITGLIKLFKYVYPIPLTLVSSATVIHDLTTLFIGLMLVIHLLPLLLVPANWPLLLSMFKTTVPRKYVEQRHPLWYRELLRRQPRPVEVPAPADVPSAPLAATPEAPGAD